MKTVHRLFIMALTCLSVAAIHATPQYVKAKKAKSSKPSGSINVAILEPTTTNGRTSIISDSTFQSSSKANKLWFDFDRGSNIVEVTKKDSKGNITKTFGTMTVDSMNAPEGSSIIVDGNGIPMIVLP